MSSDKKCNLVCVWIGLFLRFASMSGLSRVSAFFFSLCRDCCLNIVSTVHTSTTFPAPFNQLFNHGTHKSHLSTTFSLKMNLTVLFTHLKIILLQCFQFSVFNFSKISSIQIDP